MTVYVLTRPENAVSAVKLGYPVVNRAEDIQAGSKVIRWGDSQSPERTGWSLVLNKRSVLVTSIDKEAALASMSRVVNTPKLYTEGQTVPRGKKAVVRGANHSHGEGFEVVNGPYFVNAGEHATEFIPDTREYRVWFVREKTMVAKRIPRSSEGQTEADQCRSGWGYSFCAAVFQKLGEEAKKVRMAIPLDFGAMDVLWKDGEGDEPGKYYFLEVNSAPSLDHERVQTFFKTNIKAIIGPDEAPEAARVNTRRVDPAVGRSLTEPGEVQTPTPTRMSVAMSIRERVAAKAKADYDRIYNEEIERLSR